MCLTRDSVVFEALTLLCPVGVMDASEVRRRSRRGGVPNRGPTYQLTQPVRMTHAGLHGTVFLSTLVPCTRVTRAACI